MRNISKYPYLQPEIHFISDYATLKPLDKTQFDYALTEYLFVCFLFSFLVYSFVPFLTAGVKQGESCKNMYFCEANSVCDAGICSEY